MAAEIAQTNVGYGLEYFRQVINLTFEIYGDNFTINHFSSRISLTNFFHLKIFLSVVLSGKLKVTFYVVFYQLTWQMLSVAGYKPISGI